MTPTPQPRLPSVFHVRGIVSPPGNTAPPSIDTTPPVVNSAPQLTTVAEAEDPRGEKRPRQDEVTDAEEPVVKRARTAQAESPSSPDQALLNAIEAGNTSVCCSLIDKFTELLNSVLPGPKGLTPLCLAAHRGDATMLSALITAGAEIDRPASNGSTPLMFAAEYGDPALDGLTNDDVRKCPEKILLAVARQPFGPFENGELAELTSLISSQRILWSLFFPVLNDDFIACASIIGRNTDTLGPIDRLQSPTSAQRLQILIERLSDSICSPDSRQPFSGLTLSAEAEHKMNQIAEAQIRLLLKDIAHLRERFADDVTSLPGLCVTRYISITQQLNREDLYTKMTMSWGLYEPVARAVLRLIQEALGNLGLLDANSLSKGFSEKSLVEKLRVAMVDILEEWDKVPEIVAAIVERSNNEKAHGVPDLLFQQ